ncbi:hypothetical protein ACFYO0_03905 [Streptomyces sp. NPDC006365]
MTDSPDSTDTPVSPPAPDDMVNSQQAAAWNGYEGRWLVTAVRP